ncbi:MAG: SRPBCC family protein [Acidobacteria bacterium]|nr:SRPBCC family protein [Acidobacteriota bacterium]
MANKTLVTAEPNKQELTITREFDAPRELVFRAHVEPELYVQWVGPNDLEMSIQKLDAVDGGTFEFTHKRGGHSYRFFGSYHEVLKPERIIGTFEFDGLPERGHVILGKTSFEELPGNRCRLVHQSVFFSVDDRDGMVQSGMERGVAEGYNKLDTLLEKQVGSTASA